NGYSNETNYYKNTNVKSNINSNGHSKQFQRGTFNKRTPRNRKIPNYERENTLRQYYQPQHIEFYLASININEYQESVDTVNDYKLKFRYKYLEEGISIFLNENNAKIYIPINSLEAISNVQFNLIVLTLKKNCSNLERTPQQAIDIAGLHINYLVNKNNKYKGNKTYIANWGYMTSLHLTQGEDFLIKCHIDGDIRILRFKSHSQFEDIKHAIIDASNVHNITKIYYKDDDGEHITIVNTADFETALKLYKKDNKLEIWCMTG
ncbi:17282_t:CDS:2, partial [Racocetra fulgida]